MLDDKWERIQEIFLAAADLGQPERARFLDAACLDDHSLRSEIEALLQGDAAGLAEVDSAIEAETVSLLDEPSFTGTHLGPYQVLDQIGHGGMGTVYLAARDDDEFHKVVAIKVVKYGMDTQEVLRRFRHERQILAGLEHPYIARLLDGGTTPDGRPFFVMERVEGEPIEVYCRARNLDLKARLRLFLRVCDAVSHAHSVLVVHRDLKPDNILVTDDGTPKLLDFGVAKLLEPGADPDLTSTLYAMGPLTPEYASPEQVRGLAVTTATDVYALGAILYELLTGTRAQKIDTHTPGEIDRIICNVEPMPPSLVVRGLDRDLDNIVLMAMRKDRERRYASVDQFAVDIRRYLNGLPIAARRDSLFYRTGKFVRRHRLGVAASVLVLASLIAGVVVSIHQARAAESARRTAETQKQIAETQRQAAEIQKQIADRERGRAEAQTQVAKSEQQIAEQRLAEMVELANRSLYDVHSAIQKLPGATLARRQIVTTTLQFLEDLSKDAGKDDRLHLVLSAAYKKVADVQGDPVRPSLGDSRGALANYRRSEQLIRPLLARDPNRVEYLTQWIDTETSMVELLGSLGQLREAKGLGSAALLDARRLARLCKKVDCQLAEPRLCAALVLMLRNSNLEAAQDYSNEQIKSLELARQRFPADTEVGLDLATGYSQAASIRTRRGELREAVELYRRGISLREDAIRRSPPDAEAQREMMITYANLAGNLGSPFFPNLGDSAGAREYYGKALAIARDLVKADANNQVAQYDLANALLFYASVDQPSEELASSLAMLRESASILQRLITADSGSLPKLRFLAMAQEYEGRRLESLGNRSEAIASYQHSVATAEKALLRSPADLPSIAQAQVDEEAIAAILAVQGDRASALEFAQKAVARTERLLSSQGNTQEIAVRHAAEAYRRLGSVHATFGEWKEAEAAAERATALWRELEQAGSKLIRQDEAARAQALLNEASAHLQ